MFRTVDLFFEIMLTSWSRVISFLVYDFRVVFRQDGSRFAYVFLWTVGTVLPIFWWMSVYIKTKNMINRLE